MKGEFFVIATVIMIYTLVLVVQYIYDFSDINLTQLEEMGELYYMQYIKEALNSTVGSSYLSSNGCDRLDVDIKATKKFLESEMIKKGINLTINYQIQSCPTTNFNFSLKTSNLFTKTEFTYTYAPVTPPVYFDSCRVLDQPGKTYILTADITDSSAVICLDITAADITLNCQGYLIDGKDDPYGNYYGIQAYRSNPTMTNATINDCTVTDWAYGVYFYNSHNNSVNNVLATSNLYYGIYISGQMENATVVNSTANNNGYYYGVGVHTEGLYHIFRNVTANNNKNYGFELGSDTSVINSTANNNGDYGIFAGTNDKITNTTIKNNTGGIYFTSYNNDTITNSVIEGNTYGLYSEYLNTYGSPNKIYNNLLNNSNNAYIGSTSTSQCSGTWTSCSNWWNWCVYAGWAIKDCCDYAGCGWTGSACSGTTSQPCNWFSDEAQCNILSECSWTTTYYGDYWNTTKQIGTRIIGSGNIGGNYWTNPTNNGYSDNCADSNGDKFCDSAYNVTTGTSCTPGVNCGNNVDYLPLTGKT